MSIQDALSPRMVELEVMYNSYRSKDEAFEAMEAAGFKPDEVAEMLGKDVGDAYANWIYKNIK